MSALESKSIYVYTGSKTQQTLQGPSFRGTFKEYNILGGAPVSHDSCDSIAETTVKLTYII